MGLDYDGLVSEKSVVQRYFDSDVSNPGTYSDKVWFTILGIIILNKNFEKIKNDWQGFETQMISQL